jgi:hypothetical protein
MKLNIEWIECIKCGAMIFPPAEVSDFGQEVYEEVVEVPPLEPGTLPTDEELKIMNDARMAAGLPKFESVDDWVSYYKGWATSYRADRRSKAQKRLSELKAKLEKVELVEEAKAIRIRGRRHRAVLEPAERGWRLKCPICGFTLIEARW